MNVRRLCAALALLAAFVVSGCKHCCNPCSSSARPCCPDGALVPAPLPAAPAPVTAGFGPAPIAPGCCNGNGYH
jgi:hypothetical protein